VQRDLLFELSKWVESLAASARIFLGGMMLSCAVPCVGHSACTLKPYDAGVPLSRTVLDARDAFFASLCDESFSELVVYPDPRLKERFRPPSHERPFEQLTYPEEARRLGLEGKTVIAYVIETDGSVEHAVVIQSSGHRALDRAAVAADKRLRYDAPGTLDGIPVRVLTTHELPFKLKIEGARLSTAFTDDFIVGLGIRLIDLCNRGDFDALYDDLDERGKRRTQRMDIEQQLRVYNGLYGEIATARYEGLLRETTEEGTKLYELAYALDLERPGAENVLLVVTVAQHGDGLQMTSFWIDRKMTIRRHHHAHGAP
jgi:TonB family protein